MTTTFGFTTTADEACEALKNNITGKTIIVTGVSPNSIGADTARAIVAQRPAQLILASKTESKLHNVIKSLQIPVGTTVRPLVLDLGSLEAVRMASAQVSSWVKAIDAAIFTAGVMAVPQYTESEDGIELHFAINHLGHFLFANLVIDKLLAGDATVVNYSSEAHQRANPGFLDDLTYDNGKGYDKWAAYDNSKLCNIAFSVGLVQHFGERKLRSFAVDPGVILTSALTRSGVPQEDFFNKGWVDEKGNLNTAIVPKSLAQGSLTGIIAAFDRTLSNDKGYYMVDGAITGDGLLPAAVEPALAQKLWKISKKLVKQDF
ncbi:NAD(P)-binding protein [Coniochaeta sp. PMI_546]|nr:NAD(P)-binding protein [Coniochaeta sp. PMI_546]